MPYRSKRAWDAARALADRALRLAQLDRKVANVADHALEGRQRQSTSRARRAAAPQQDDVRHSQCRVWNRRVDRNTQVPDSAH